MTNSTAAAMRAADAIERIVISPLHGGLPASALNCIAAIIDAEIRPLVEALAKMNDAFQSAEENYRDSLWTTGAGHILKPAVDTLRAALARAKGEA